MAIIASITADDVGGMFTRRNSAVVAAVASANDLRVVDRKYWGEYVCAMAVFADIAGRYVREIFAGRINAVMAVDTISCDVQVIEVRR